MLTLTHCRGQGDAVAVDSSHVLADPAADPQIAVLRATIAQLKQRDAEQREYCVNSGRRSWPRVKSSPA